MLPANLLNSDRAGAPMLNIKKILLPLDLEETVLPVAVIRQAAALAHHFHSEILVLHVIRTLSYWTSSDSARELIEKGVANEQERLKDCLGSELHGLSVRSLVVKGDPALEILRTVADQKIDLIVMPTHGYGAYERFLVGSVTAKVLHNGQCPVWAGAHLEGESGQPFAIRNVLCAVDFSTHSPKTIRWAQDVANEFGARLTLAHVTPGVEIYGPGGYHVVTRMKEELVNGSMEQMAKIQQELGTSAEVFIGSGDAPKVITQAAKETKADLLVVGCRSLDHRFGNTAYGIIRESRVPVFSV
jgi:nucleotide-binding universal stress UspA family protein